MKPVLFALLCSGGAVVLHAQATIWAPVGAEWYHRQGAGIGEPIGLGYYYSTVAGDTVLNGQPCRKIERIKKIWTGAVIPLEPAFTYAQHDSVYYYAADANRFLLTFDFSAAVGDTLTFPSPEAPAWAPEDTTFQVRVDSIVRRAAGQDSLRFFYVSALDGTDSWGFYGGWYAEKIGGKMFQTPFPAITIPEIDGFFRCYADSTTFIQLSVEACDYPFSSGVQAPASLTGLRLAPNPVWDALFLHFPEHPGEGMAGVYDLTGRLFKSARLEGADTRIDLRDCPAGIYLLRIWTKEGNIARTMVKM